MTILQRLDYRIGLTGEENMLLDSVRQLAREQIAPRAAQIDRTGEFPWENVQAINKLGLNAMFVPDSYGGAQVSYTAYLACVREITRACAATGIIWATNFHAMKPLIDWGTEEQKSRQRRTAPAPPRGRCANAVSRMCATCKGHVVSWVRRVGH